VTFEGKREATHWTFWKYSSKMRDDRGLSGTYASPAALAKRLSTAKEARKDPKGL